MAGRREFQPAHYEFNPGYAGRAPYTGHGGGRYGARTVVALSAAVVEVQALIQGTTSLNRDNMQ
jgi:hypothetical protein